MPSHWSTESRLRTGTRASAPIIGSVLLIGVAVILVTLSGTAMFGFDMTPNAVSATTIDLSIEGNTLTFTHAHGESLDVRQLSLRIFVDNEPLDQQPQLPFFAQTGFQSGPTGPFNSASDPKWEVGQTARLTIAGTNSPTIKSGSTVSVRIYTDETAVTRITTTA